MLGKKISVKYWEDVGNLKVTKLEGQSMKCPKYICYPIWRQKKTSEKSSNVRGQRNSMDEVQQEMGQVKELFVFRAQ